MTNEQWDKAIKAIVEKLDSIDLLAEMKNEREDIYDFMDRLEKKHPFKIYGLKSLFDGYSADDFSSYLFIRYKREQMYCEEYTKIDVVKRNEV